MTLLTVLTFNIRHGAGTDDRLDLHRISRVIDQQRADVVALQEVDRHFGTRSDHVDQPAWLGDRLRMTPLFGPNLCYPAPQAGAPAQEYGSALLTTRPVKSWRAAKLPCAEGQEARGLLHAQLDVDGHIVAACCLHLSHETSDSRFAQVKSVAKMVDLTSSAVVMGDLNAHPGSDEIGYLNDRLTDAWQACGSGPGYTFPSSRPDRRIDYIFISPNMAAAQVSVVGVDSSSDHLAVCATLRIDNRQEVPTGRGTGAF